MGLWFFPLQQVKFLMLFVSLFMWFQIEVHWNSYSCSSVGKMIPFSLLMSFKFFFFFFDFLKFKYDMVNVFVICLVFSEFLGFVVWCPSLILKNSLPLLPQVFLLLSFLFLLLWYSSYTYVITFDVPNFLYDLFCFIKFFPFLYSIIFRLNINGF